MINQIRLCIKHAKAGTPLALETLSSSCFQQHISRTLLLFQLLDKPFGKSATMDLQSPYIMITVLKKWLFPFSSVNFHFLHIIYTLSEIIIQRSSLALSTTKHENHSSEKLSGLKVEKAVLLGKLQWVVNTSSQHLLLNKRHPAETKYFNLLKAIKADSVCDCLLVASNWCDSRIRWIDFSTKNAKNDR